VTSNHSGARNEASDFALRIDLRTYPQTTFEITPALASRICRKLTAGLIRQVALPLAFGIERRVPVEFAPQTLPEIEVDVAF